MRVSLLVAAALMLAAAPRGAAAAKHRPKAVTISFVYRVTGHYSNTQQFRVEPCFPPGENASRDGQAPTAAGTVDFDYRVVSVPFTVPLVAPLNPEGADLATRVK